MSSEVTGDVTVLARAMTDGEDRLVSADAPLAELQLKCGGEMPGILAPPALLELVRTVRRHRLKLTRMIAAQDGDDSINAWVEAEPRHDDQAGCSIALVHLRRNALPAEDVEQAELRRIAIARQVAELTARLDSRQRLLTVECDAPDLAEIHAAMNAAIGRRWIDVVPVRGNALSQSLHWRLLDGLRLDVPNSPRTWRASLVPQAAAGNEPRGFELLFIADEPAPPDDVDEPSVAAAVSDRRDIIGQNIAPVLRQPIARIIANAETIRTRLAGPLPEDYAGYASEIATAGEHLLGLLDDLADLEVVEADDFSTEPDPIDLAEVARQASGILNVRAREKNITVIPPEPGACLPAMAEFRRVLQVLLNLVGNAIRYAPEGTQIQLQLEGGEGRARVIVKDEGPGLSDDQQKVLFRKFERLGRSGDGGSGLGLYISRKLARAMNGDLTVESSPGQGSRFILDVPADESRC